MSCKICGRYACMPSFHSVEEQDKWDDENPDDEVKSDEAASDDL